ncbi:MAG: kelch repeat-containing protein [Rhodothermales bacterium]
MHTLSRFILLFLGLSTGFAAPAAHAQSWVAGPPMPTPRAEAAVSVLGGDLYVIGGRNVAGTPLGRVERFDGSEWETVASLRDERYAAAAAAYNGQIVLMGGYEDGGEITDDVEVYVVGENDWESFEHMERDRAGHGAVVLNGSVYALGGVSGGGGPQAGTEVYDGDDWYLYAPWVLDPPRAYFGVANVGGVAYLAGGLSQFGPLDLLERYAVGAGAEALAPLPSPRGGLALAGTDGALFAIGGVDPSGTVLATVTRYDIASNTWTPVASLNTAREGAVAAVIDGTIYVVGGRDANGNVLGTMERYLLSVDDEDDTTPTAFDLGAAYPNPFAGTTTLPLRLDRAGAVTLTVYDVRGRQVAVLVDGVLTAGEHRVAWDGTADDGRRLAPGVYVARLTGAVGHAVTKLTLLR